MSNSSGSVERFLLGPNETKVYQTLAPGGNELVLDITNPINQGIDGTLASGGNANGVVDIATSEDGTTFTTVGSAATVVPGGKAAFRADVGRYARVQNTGSGLVSCVLKPLHRIQPKVSL